MSDNTRTFASDNAAPVQPEILESLTAANRGHAIAYGDDRWTRSAVEALREVFRNDCEVSFVYNGTWANVVGLQTAIASFNSIICSDLSHINLDECGAVENSTVSKLVALPSVDGRITPDQIERELDHLGS